MQESLTCKTKSLLALMTNRLDGLHMEWFGSLRKSCHFGTKCIKTFLWLKKKKKTLFDLLRTARFGQFTGSTVSLSGSHGSMAKQFFEWTRPVWSLIDDWTGRSDPVFKTFVIGWYIIKCPHIGYLNTKDYKGRTEN